MYTRNKIVYLKKKKEKEKKEKFCLNYLCNYEPRILYNRVTRRLILVRLKRLVGRPPEQLRIHDEPHVDSALPPPIPGRHLVLTKRKMS